MKKIIYELVTNRLGIILAAFNLCVTALIFSKGFVVKNIFEVAVIAQNTPAAVFAYIFSYVPLYIFPQLHQYKISFFPVIPFIALQWLLIAWTAKKIARKICFKSNGF